MKKILSVLLAIIAVFSLTTSAFTAFADDIEENTIIENEEISENTDNPDTPDEPEKHFDVTMYLCATANSLSGHVWLYFVNNSNYPVNIGYYENLQPGQGISVGSLNFFRKSGGGTYYNGEAMMAAMDGKLDDLRKHTTSLEMSLTEEQLEKVNNKIKSMNFYDFIFCNCGVFATQVWNSVSSKKVVHLVFPVFTVAFMKILGAKTGVLTMDDPRDGVGAWKQRKNGCEVANNKSFNYSCVNT